MLQGKSARPTMCEWALNAVKAARERAPKAAMTAAMTAAASSVASGVEEREEEAGGKKKKFWS